MAVIMTGPEFAQARRQLGLSQRALAAALEVAQTTVCRWERDGLPSCSGLVRRELRRLLARAEARVRIERKLMLWPESYATRQTRELVRQIEHLETCGVCLAEMLLHYGKLDHTLEKEGCVA